MTRKTGLAADYYEHRQIKATYSQGGGLGIKELFHSAYIPNN